MIGGLNREVIAAVEELRNLKTAHLHGLGNTLFYRYYFTVDELTPRQITRVKVVCTLADDALFPPYLTLTWVGNEWNEWRGFIFISSTVDEPTKSVTFDVGLVTDTSELPLAITSSSRVVNIERVQ